MKRLCESLGTETAALRQCNRLGLRVDSAAIQVGAGLMAARVEMVRWSDSGGGLTSQMRRSVLHATKSQTSAQSDALSKDHRELNKAAPFRLAIPKTGKGDCRLRRNELNKALRGPSTVD